MAWAPHDGSFGKKIAEFEVEYDEVLKLKELYKEMYEWAKGWGFESVGPGEPETLYMELVNDKGMRNQHIWWRFERVETKFAKFFLKIDFQTLAVSDIEIMVNGKKVKTQRGDIIIRVQGWLHLDYKGEWRNHPFLKHFLNWFIDRWYKKEIDNHKRELWFEVYNLEDTIKQYLELNTLYDLPRPFNPPKGVQ